MEQPQAQLYTPTRQQVVPSSIYEKMVRRRAARLSASRFIDLAEWVFTYRRAEGLTQRAFARRFQIPERQVKTYEAAAKWPEEAKNVVREMQASFLVTNLTRQFAARAWPSGAALIKALEQHAGRRPAIPLDAADRDPNVVFLEEDLGAVFAAPVKIIGNGVSGELRIGFTSPEDLERILGRLRESR